MYTAHEMMTFFFFLHFIKIVSKDALLLQLSVLKSCVFFKIRRSRHFKMHPMVLHFNVNRDVVMSHIKL